MRSLWLLGCCACIAPHAVATVALPTAAASARDVPPVPCVVANDHFVADPPMPLVGTSGTVFGEFSAAERVELTVGRD